MNEGQLRIGGAWAPAAGDRVEVRSSYDGRTVGRAGDMIRLAGFEGTQLYGDSLPLDAHRGTGFGKIGFTPRQPCGVDRGEDHRPVRPALVTGSNRFTRLENHS